jgi:hypothetical protein
MAMTIEQLTATPTRDQIFDQMITWLVAQGIPADQWRRGGTARSILRVVASSYYALAVLISFIAGAGFLPTATGDFLTLLARYVYGVERVVSTFATGQILASNSSGGNYTYQPGELLVANTITKKGYRNTAAVTLNSGDVDVPVDIEAIDLGTASNATAGQITTVSISDAGVTCTNPFAVLAQNAWTDEVLRAACLAKLGALSLLGPRGAYVYAIQTATFEGAPVNVNRWSISPSSSKGLVTIRIASPSGPVTADDLQAVKDRIEEVARPDSVTTDTDTVGVSSASRALTVWAKAVPGVDAAAIEEAVTVAIDDMLAVYPIAGIPKPPSTTGYLYADEIRATANGSHASIYAVDMTPDTDITVPDDFVASLSFTVDVRIVTLPTGASA